MADVPDRDELDVELARRLGRLLRAQEARLIEALGDPPDVANVPAGFWDEAGEELRRALRPFLQEVYESQAAELLSGVAVGVEWTLINEAAAAWARDYTYELVTGITDRTRSLLREVMGSAFEEPLTLREIREQLSGAFGPVRAEMIATTEITRASVEGERALIAELGRQGVQMVPIWQTRNDEMVCEICGPRHGKHIEGGDYPPAHPRCRCWVTYEHPAVAGTGIPQTPFRESAS